MMQEYFDEDEQIIYQGHTPDRVWRALAQRSRDTHRKVVLRCPLCNSEIHPTDTTHLHCRSCDAPVKVFQHREHTKTADTRLIYSQVKGHRRAVLSLDLHCLSCEQSLKTDETCDNTCEIQTYLVLELQDGELYIKRWVIRRDAHFQREPTDIPIRPLPDNAILTRATDTPQNLPQNLPQVTSDFQISEHPNAHTDIAAQIVAYLTDAPNHTATTAEMRLAIGCTTEGFNKAVKKLITLGKIRKIKRGVYALNLP